MFADVIDGISAASFPSVYVPNDSPTSALRSTRRITAINHKARHGHKPVLRRTKQKGTALLRCPPAPLIWLPQQFTAPCRNQTSDLPGQEAMGVPAILP